MHVRMETLVQSLNGPVVGLAAIPPSSHLPFHVGQVACTTREFCVRKTSSSSGGRVDRPAL